LNRGVISTPGILCKRQYTISRPLRNAPQPERTPSRTRLERAPSRGKSEISAIFLAHLIAANTLIRYVGIAVGDSPLRQSIGVYTMNQRDLLAAVQKKSGLALKDVKSVVEAFFDTVTKTSKKEPVRTTLGTFVVAKRAARMGRNPQTGEAIKIAASKKFRFRPSKATKEAVM
jgi:DNA-binding protein HU-beta